MKNSITIKASVRNTTIGNFVIYSRDKYQDDSKQVLIMNDGNSNSSNSRNAYGY